MTFRVETTSQADEDAAQILGWLLRNDAGDAGLRWFHGLEDAIHSLSTFPNRCPIAPENSEFPFKVRHLLYGNRPHIYRVLFTIEGQRVIILHIRHGRRLPER